jgi:hypothetical protein
MGCLFGLLLVAVIAYVGTNVGSIYFRYYAFEDQIRQSARFAAGLSDSALRKQLSFSADSLGLPASAHVLNIVRDGRSITISTSYTEALDLRVYTHYFRFRPRIVANF